MSINTFEQVFLKIGSMEDPSVLFEYKTPVGNRVDDEIDPNEQTIG